MPIIVNANWNKEKDKYSINRICSAILNLLPSHVLLCDCDPFKVSKTVTDNKFAYKCVDYHDRNHILLSVVMSHFFNFSHCK